MTMASLNFLHPSAPSVSHCVPSSSSCFARSFVTFKVQSFPTKGSLQSSQRRRFQRRLKRSLVVESALDEVYVVDPPPPRPTPPSFDLISSLKLNLLVFQRIDIVSKDFDNIVELQLGAPWPLQPLEVTATLAHKFELTGFSTVQIIFEKTTVKTTGNLSQLPPLEIPQIPDALRRPSNPGSGDFEVTYLDADTRITRGDRGELRVFVIA